MKGVTTLMLTFFVFHGALSAREASSPLCVHADTPDSLPRASLMTDSLRIQADSLKPETRVPRFRKLENEAFFVGEKLEFEIGWKFVKAGHSSMTVVDTSWFFGRPCYRIVTTAQSSPFIDTFYKVRDRVESNMDMQGLFSWKFEKRLREGKFRRDRYTEIDQFNHVAYLKKDTVAVPPYVQDILSSFYYVRTLPLEVGKQYDIENISDAKVYPLRVLVHRKERVEVPAGKFNCIVVEPVLRGEGLFNQKGTLTVWLTDDARKIPVQMKSEVFIGTVDVKLKKIRDFRQAP